VRMSVTDGHTVISIITSTSRLSVITVRRQSLMKGLLRWTILHWEREPITSSTSSAPSAVILSLHQHSLSPGRLLHSERTKESLFMVTARLILRMTLVLPSLKAIRIARRVTFACVHQNAVGAERVFVRVWVMKCPWTTTAVEALSRRLEGSGIGSASCVLVARSLSMNLHSSSVIRRHIASRASASFSEMKFDPFCCFPRSLFPFLTNAFTICMYLFVVLQPLVYCFSSKDSLFHWRSIRRFRVFSRLPVVQNPTDQRIRLSLLLLFPKRLAQPQIT